MTWLRLDQAGEHAKVSEATIRTWIRAGLVNYKIGGTVLIDQNELDDFIRGHRRRKIVRRRSRKTSRP